MADNPNADRPNPARMYDYWLGGTHNTAIDRMAADKAASVNPDIPLALRTNRHFLRRAVTFLTKQGIDQFLDIGSGIPTSENVHEVAHQHNPDARIVYVDIDPIAVAYGQHILQGQTQATTIESDIIHFDEICSHSETKRLINFQRPVAILLVSMLHFVPNDTEVQRVIAQIKESMSAGSYLAISHATIDSATPQQHTEMREIYSKTTMPIKGRTKREITALFDGLQLVEPGVVFAPLWRPDGKEDLWLDQPDRSLAFVGVGKKV
ncbi:MAG: SAM-dependent methyltransferase [Chloroflexota bacterium]